MRYLAAVPFDSAGWWQIRVLIDGPAGGGVLEARVEATPEGIIGPIGLVFYALPFILIAFLGCRAMFVVRASQKTDTMIGSAADTEGGNGSVSRAGD